MSRTELVSTLIALDQARGRREAEARATFVGRVVSFGRALQGDVGGPDPQPFVRRWTTCGTSQSMRACAPGRSIPLGPGLSTSPPTR